MIHPVQSSIQAGDFCSPPCLMTPEGFPKKTTETQLLRSPSEMPVQSAHLPKTLSEVSEETGIFGSEGGAPWPLRCLFHGAKKWWVEMFLAIKFRNPVSRDWSWVFGRLSCCFQIFQWFLEPHANGWWVEMTNSNVDGLKPQARYKFTFGMAMEREREREA